MYDPNTVRPVKKVSRRLRKGRAFTALLILFCLIAGITYAFFSGSDKPRAGLATPGKGKINILVLGVDERGDDAGRSDTSIVVTIDTDAKKATILSIPRDTRLKIPGHSWDKINHAYAFGGTQLSKTAIEDLLGIPINYTVMINFTGFVRMIDAIGGVTIDVDKRMKYADPYDDNGGLYIDIKPGVQKMNGKTAIQYVRYRDEEGDIGRVERQQKFLKAVLHEFTKPQLITRLPDIVKQFSTAVKTDMPTYEMVKLVPVVSDAAKAGLAAEWVTGTPVWIRDVSYWLPDIKQLRQKIAQLQGITVDEKYRHATELLAEEYIQSVPKERKIVDASPSGPKTAITEKKPLTPLAKTTTDQKSDSQKPKTENTTLTTNSVTKEPASHTTGSTPTTSDTTKGKTP
ncbi:MAG: cell envelope-related transcriptional attenuator [Firmicutes bacterium]|nr:cell envelope-related transcriptional attenuator [Bacillota bacterium]